MYGFARRDANSAVRRRAGALIAGPVDNESFYSCDACLLRITPPAARGCRRGAELSYCRSLACSVLLSSASAFDVADAVNPTFAARKHDDHAVRLCDAVKQWFLVFARGSRTTPHPHFAIIPASSATARLERRCSSWQTALLWGPPVSRCAPKCPRRCWMNGGIEIKRLPGQTISEATITEARVLNSRLDYCARI